MGNHDAVRKLLRSEANLGLKNWKEETPIVHIAPDIMEEYLDDCLEGEELTTADKFKITFKYHFLGPPRMKTDGNQPLLKNQVTIFGKPLTFVLLRLEIPKSERNFRRRSLCGIWPKFQNTDTSCPIPRSHPSCG